MTEHATPSHRARSTLEQVRDVALTVMAVLVSVLTALFIYLIVAAGSALYRVDDKIDIPVPAVPDSFAPQPADPPSVD